MSRNEAATAKTLKRSRRGALVGRFLLWAGLAMGWGLYATTGHAQSAGSNSPTKRLVILVTGSTNGLGREVALRLGDAGAQIIVHGRSRERGMEVVNQIERQGGSARFYQADFASLAEVRKFAETILHDYDRLDVLINNAGIWLMRKDSRQVSADGHELHFAVNYLSHFLLTRMLLPRLIASAPSRIVNVASIAQFPLDFDNVMLERDYSHSRAYGQSELAQIIFTFDLARELKGTGVVVSAVHPSSLMDTHMVLSRGARPRASVQDGVRAVLQLVTTPNLQSGQYFSVLNPERANDHAYDEAARQMLRKLSLQLTGLRD